VSAQRALQRRLRSLATLEEAIGALRSLSAQQFRVARAGLAPARAYRDEVLRVAHAILDQAPSVPGEPQALVLVGADLGLCAAYAAQVAREAIACRAELGPGPVYCIGRRPLTALARAGITPERVYAAAASTAGLSRLLLPLVTDLLEAQHSGRFSGIVVIAARFAGVGRFDVVRTRVLPAELAGQAAPPRSYSSPRQLRGLALREYLFVSLHEALVDALAAEHGKRLVVAQTAHDWLRGRIEAAHHRLAAIARESSTQEVIELASASRARAARLEQR
jgi:F-type H+-transporting ATPase subunit gamma